MPLEAIVPAPYWQGLRQRVIGFMALGGSARAAAMRFDVSVSSAIRWAQRWRAEGHARPRAMGGDRRSRLGEHRARVLQLVARQPDLTLQEIRGALAASCGITVGLSTVHRFLGAHSLTRKKRPYTRPSRACPGAGRGPPGRRDLGRHEHDAPLWPVCARPAAAGFGPARSLEADHLGFWTTHGRDQRALCVRGRHQRPAVSRLH